MNKNNNKAWNKNGYDKNEMNEKKCEGKNCNKNAMPAGSKETEPKHGKESSQEKQHSESNRK